METFTLALVPEGHKRCSGCGLWKPAERFTRDCNAPDGRYLYCRDCRRLRGRADYVRKREVLADRALAYACRRLGITVDHYWALFNAQRGVCAICRRPERATGKDRLAKRLSIDHNHTSGRVRGLLCAACNQAIGLLEEDALRFQSAADYLAQW